MREQVVDVFLFILLYLLAKEVVIEVEERKISLINFLFLEIQTSSHW